MKLSIANLEKAQKLAAQRVFLQREHAQITSTGDLVFANAKVVIQPRAACRVPALTIEIEENNDGAIASAIRDFVTRNISERIARLDEELAELGIEVTD